MKFTLEMDNTELIKSLDTGTLRLLAVSLDGAEEKKARVEKEEKKEEVKTSDKADEVESTPAKEEVAYSFDQLQACAAGILREGKREELAKALQEMGLESMMDLKEDQYGAFADKLKALGGSI